jgi:hypothetical protein
LIPKIDDDGNIDGSILLFNHMQSNEGIWTITGDIDKIKECCPE